MKVFNIMQYEKNPITGEELLTEEKIESLLSHKTIHEWARIVHDEDVFNEDDEMDDFENVKRRYQKLSEEEKEKISEQDYIKLHHWKKIGIKKPRHHHIVLRTTRNTEVEKIAEWLDIAPQFIDLPKGRGNQFLDCVQYLTHESEKEQSKGKHRYPDEKVIANFDWRTAIDEYVKEKERYGSKGKKDYFRHSVLYQGMTLREVKTTDEDAYLEDIDKLKKLRLDYLQRWATMPSIKINFYVEGSGGIGKGTVSRLLAKALYPDMAEEDIIFPVGGTNVTFEGYDGEPVMIWNDRRSVSFVRDFGREQFFDMFDSHPTGSRFNVKNSSVRLTNTINIVNGVEPFKDFLDGLAGEYKDRDGIVHKSEDKSQSYRRFPIIICLKENDFDLLINKGFANNTREYLQYIEHKRIKGNFAKIIQALDGEALTLIANQSLKPVVNETKKLLQLDETKISDVNDIPDEFKSYGQMNN